MSDDATPRLSLPYLAAAQAQKHVTLNEGLSRLDGLVQTAVESRATDAQPASPADGALYIMTAAASGIDWAGKAAGTVMRFEAGAWAQMAVAEGHIAYVVDEAAVVIFDGADWASLGVGPGAELQDLGLLGVNATADATNKLSVASAAVLFNHAGAGSQVKVNKAAAGDTGSHLFQTGFSGRAEFGLIGGDDFKLKVSPDGSAWTDVMSVDKATGRATFTLSPMQSQLDVFTASGTYNVPAWARRLRIVCIAAGGGGGSGAAGTSAADRGGGGGGGAGGRSEEEYDVSDVAGSLTVTVGAAGASGASVTGTNNGSAGGVGGDSYIASAGAVILRAFGGTGGAGGATAKVSGGFGGIGTVTRSNGGGSGIAASNGEAGLDRDHCSAPGGGGGGGGLSTGGSAGSGGQGGYGYWIGSFGNRSTPGAGGAAGGSLAGVAGSAKAWLRGCGAGGGGGAASASAGGGAGGAGGEPGGGGGGGGGTRDGFNSGAGGAGGRGEVWIMALG